MVFLPDGRNRFLPLKLKETQMSKKQCVTEETISNTFANILLRPEGRKLKVC